MHTYKIFITKEHRPRLDELIESFHCINERIINYKESKNFNSLTIELNDEEVSILKIALDPEEYVMTNMDAMKPSDMLLDLKIELDSLED